MATAAPTALDRVLGAAVAADLSAAHLRAAGGAGHSGDVAQVAALHPVHLAGLLEGLLLGGLGLRRGDLLVHVGRAPLAELQAFVEADRLADIPAATGALLEHRPDLS